VLVVLKNPENIKDIKGSFESSVQGLDVLKYNYRVIKAYEIDKNEILKQGKIVLYPLRVFMKYEEEDEQDHIQECLYAVENLDDKDYYFLTVECIKKLYKKSKYEKYVKEEILMKSSLYKEPYEKGMEEGRKIEKTDMVLRFLTKRFGLLPDEIKEKVRKLDMTSLDVILDKVLEYKDLEDFKKFIH